MKALIIINKFATFDSYKKICESFYLAFKNHNIDYDILNSADIPIVINDNTNFNQYDFCLYLDKDKYLARILENKGIRLFNNSRAIELCDDKMLTHIELEKHNIPQPKTIPGTLCYIDNCRYPKESLDIIEHKLGYPLVFKECFGSLGKGIHLVENRNQLEELSSKYIKTPHLFQQFIKTSYGVDYRVIILNHKYIAHMKRISKNDFRSNIELGGVGEVSYIPDSFIKLAIEVSNVLDLDYCGVDLLIGENNTPLICEVNSNAFFNKIGELNNINIADLYVEYMMEAIKNGN